MKLSVAEQGELREFVTVSGPPDVLAAFAIGDNTTLLSLLRGDSANARAREPVVTEEIIAAIDWTEVNGPWVDRLRAVLAAGTVDVANTRVRGMFEAAFNPGTTTRARLIALASRPATLIEDLTGRSGTLQRQGLIAVLRPLRPNRIQNKDGTVTEVFDG